MSQVTRPRAPVKPDAISDNCPRPESALRDALAAAHFSPQVRHLAAAALELPSVQWRATIGALTDALEEDGHITLAEHFRPPQGPHRRIRRGLAGWQPCWLLLFLRGGVGNRVKALRIHRGEPQFAAFRAAQLVDSTIVRIERGHNNPRPATLARLAQWLEVKPEVLTAY